MRRSRASIAGRLTLCSGLVAAAGVWAVCLSATANADEDDNALNGTFTAISDGQWAKTNDRFHDEATITSTWTIATTCSTYLDCSGHMSSDQGWSADVRYVAPLWVVSRTLDGWEQCADGATAQGVQTFKFFVDQYNEPMLKGWDNTLGPSGGCDMNKVLNIELPFKLIPVG